MFLIDLGQIVINPDCVPVFLGVLRLDPSCDWLNTHPILLVTCVPQV